LEEKLANLERLTPEERRRLLAQLLQKKERESGMAPLSSAQRRLWFLEQLKPELPYNNMTEALRFKGKLDVAKLQRSLEGVIRRHDSLRTSFQTESGEPVQKIAADVTVSLPLVDLSSLPPEKREERARQLAVEEAGKSFDLTQAPLLRARLLRLEEEDHIFILAQHHIISDGWSMAIFFRELAALYQEASTLPELTCQYGDYARWQQGWLHGDEQKRQAEYWKKELAGAPPCLELPTDRPRPETPTYRGALARFQWDPPLSERVRERCPAEGVTLFMFLLTAFQVLLSRYADQEDLVVGTPVAGRTQEEMEQVIGFFVNTLVLRTDLSGDSTFRSLLQQVKETCLEAYSHQEMPFEKVVEALAPDRTSRYHPLFQVMFMVQNTPAKNLSLPGITVESFPFDNGVAKFDLTFCLEESEGRLAGWLEYSTELFHESTIRRWLEHYRILLEEIVADPDRRISELPLLTQQERHQLLVEWDRTGRDEGAEVGIHTLFEAQAEKTPQAEAISHPGGVVRYGELLAVVDRIAHGLRQRGVARGDVVVVWLEEGPDAIGTLLGIAKAGGVFLFLDADAPTERVRRILEEVQPRCLITTEKKKGRVEETASTVWLMDQVTDGGNGESERLEEGLNPSDPVYLVYTSGSTGSPKGILQSHRGLTQFVRWFGHTFDVKERTRVAQWASIAYDAAYIEILSALCHGATLCVPPSSIRQDPQGMMEWLRTERITLLQTVPSFVQSMVQSVRNAPAGGESFRTLEWMLVAGEVLPRSLVQTWWQTFPRGPQLVNLYGPTESILATWHPVQKGDENRTTIPVGKPIAGRHILILDDQGRLCPVGGGGEIYIRSNYLTLGYYGRPEETDAAFIRDPLGEGWNERVYRTGDRGCWLPDGTLQFRGRRDHQVKVRGNRVEMEEIEHVLTCHPGVRECTVVDQKRSEGDIQIVAYVVPQGEANRLEWRAYLEHRLPSYMIPSVFVSMDSLPRTVTGKVDRQHLPVPTDAGRVSELESGEPMTDLEETIADIWRDVLGLDVVGRKDHFFVLGGHSLLATQVVNRIRDELEVDVPLYAFFEAPTIAGLAEWIVQQLLERVDPAWLEEKGPERG
jgi:amino acid adenylation domain-containing protein